MQDAKVRRMPLNYVAQIALGSALLAAIAFRMTLGIDFTDESSYVAQAYRLAFGDKPFVDDKILHQTSALLTIPLIKLHFLLFGGITGLFLSQRIWAFLLTCCAASVVNISLRKMGVKSGPALAISICMISWVLYVIPNLSYNTISALLLIAGLFSLAFFEHGAGFGAFGAGLALGIATIAYPTLGVVPVVVLVALWLNGQRGRVLYGFVAGFMLIGVPFFFYLLWVGPAQILDDIHFQWQAYQLQTFYNHSQMLRALMGRGPLIVTAGAAAFAFSRKVKDLKLPGHGINFLVAATALTILLSLKLFLIQKHSLLDPIDYLISLSFSGFFYLVFEPDRDLRWRLLTFVFAPSMVAGLVFASTSGNGACWFFWGGLPAAIMALGLFSRAESTLPSARLRTASLWLLAVTLVVHQYRVIYRDKDISKLSYRVMHGAFAGMVTTAERGHLIETLTSLAASLPNQDRRLIAFDNFPAGYLITETRPAVCMTWIYTSPDSAERAHRQALVDCIRNQATDQTYALQLLSDPLTIDQSEIRYFDYDPLMKVVSSCTESVVASEKQFRFLRLSGSCLKG